ALPVDRLVDGPRRRGRRDVGRRGRVLLRRPPAAGRRGPAPEGALHGGPASPLRGDRLPRAAPGKVPGAAPTLQTVPRVTSRTDRLHPRPQQARPWWPAPGGRLERDQAPPRAGDDARREGVLEPLRPPVYLALPRRASLRVPGGRPGASGLVSAGGVRHGHVRR